MFIQAVKNFAIANYEKDGWDIVVECYTDQEIAEIIGKARSEKSAINRVKAHVRPSASYRAEICAEAF